MIMSPTVGRIVWYHPSDSERSEPGGRKDPGSQPLAAMVAYVHGYTIVNLTISDTCGGTYGATSVTLKQDGHPAPNPAYGYCEWMPFQRGKAMHDAAKAVA